MRSAMPAAWAASMNWVASAVSSLDASSSDPQPAKTVDTIAKETMILPRRRCSDDLMSPPTTSSGCRNVAADTTDRATRDHRPQWSIRQAACSPRCDDAPLWECTRQFAGGALQVADDLLALRLELLGGHEPLVAQLGELLETIGRRRGAGRGRRLQGCPLHRVAQILRRALRVGDLVGLDLGED